MTGEERLVFIAGVIEAAPVGSPDWILLLELFTCELKAIVAAGDLIAAEPASGARN